jgi:hypothetical protein
LMVGFIIPTLCVLWPTSILSQHKARLEFRLVILPDLDCPLP